MNDFILQGFSVQGVIGSPGGSPDFTYTIGLQLSVDHPDLIIIGLPFDSSAQYLGHAFHSIDKASFRFKPGQQLNNFISDYPMAVVQCRADVFDTHLCQAKFLYEGLNPPFRKPLSAFQLVFCDKQRRYPWDAGYTKEKCPQPLLGCAPLSLEDVDMEPFLSAANTAIEREFN